MELTLRWAQGLGILFDLTRVKEAKDNKAQERKRIIIIMNMILMIFNEEIKI